MEFRKSTYADKQVIKQMIEECFGIREGVLEGIENGRYTLAVDEDGNVMALIAIREETSYPGYEVEWACTFRKYRFKGVMTALLEHVIKEVPRPLYYSAWRKQNDEKAMVHGVLKKLGFEEVLHPRVAWKTPHNCEFTPEICVGFNCKPCYCYEDLWVLE